MKKAFAPFTKEQLDNIKVFQENSSIHPFTCGGEGNHSECERISRSGEGILVAKEKGLKCPYGKYTQNWVHKFMAEKFEPKEPG